MANTMLNDKSNSNGKDNTPLTDDEIKFLRLIRQMREQYGYKMLLAVCTIMEEMINKK